MRRLFAFMTIGIMAIASSGIAHAASLFQFEASGTVNVAFNSGAINLGDNFLLTFVYNADTLDSNASPDNGRFDNPFVGEIVAQVGSETFRSDASAFGFMQTSVSSFVVDQSFFGSKHSAATDSGTVTDAFISFFLDDRDKTALSSDALPTSLDLADFLGPDDGALLRVHNGVFTSGGFFGTANADITSLSITQVSTVPLPTGVLLLLSGLGVIGVMRHRRMAAAQSQ